MSTYKREPIDHKRYFNDPEYRKKILKERAKSSSNKKRTPSSTPNHLLSIPRAAKY